uniref:Uncharacterized protein n=1 Tax=Setaria italica TaxID=4555 RepID=K3ZKS5_SETIT
MIDDTPIHAEQRVGNNGCLKELMSIPLARRERGLPTVISAGNGMPSTVTVSVVSEPTAHVTTDCYHQATDCFS